MKVAEEVSADLAAMESLLNSVNNKHLFMCGIATNIFTKGLFIKVISLF